MTEIAMTLFARFAFCLCQDSGETETSFFFVDNWSFMAESLADLRAALAAIQSFAVATCVKFRRANAGPGLIVRR